MKYMFLQQEGNPFFWVDCYFSKNKASLSDHCTVCNKNNNSLAKFILSEITTLTNIRLLIKRTYQSFRSWLKFLGSSRTSSCNYIKLMAYLAKKRCNHNKLINDYCS